MSAPGADPLAAIRQRYQGSAIDTHGPSEAAIGTLLDIWDTRESALRALVAQWREEIGGDPLDRFDDGWVAAKGGCIEQLERLLSGPQPTPTPEHQP
jgi:hypothetical protein